MAKYSTLPLLSEISVLVFLHICAIIVWVGAHFFEALILHVSLRGVAEKAKLELYSRILPRFNKVTGIAADFTIYLGILLASDMQLGSLSFVYTTPWGLLSTLGFIAMLIGLVAPIQPRTISRLFNLSLAAALLALIAAIASVLLKLELKNVLSSNWGIVILTGGVFAVLLLFVGASQGLKRIQIGILSAQVLAGQGGEEASKRLKVLERKMLGMLIPENVVALIVIALMVYAANPFYL